MCKFKILATTILTWYVFFTTQDQKSSGKDFFYQRKKTARPAPPIDVVDGVFHQVGEDPTEVGRPLVLVNDHSPLGLRSGAPRVMEGHLQSDELKDLSVSLLLVIEA